MTDPTELDRLDPPPGQGPPPAPLPRRRPPRTLPRRKGPAETAVLRDLRKFPEDLRKSAVAAAALLLARQLDDGGTTSRDMSRYVRELADSAEAGSEAPEDIAVRLRNLASQIENGLTPRDAAGHAREMRMCMAQLREWNPGGETGDATDEARAQVESARGLYAVPEA